MRFRKEGSKIGALPLTSKNMEGPNVQEKIIPIEKETRGEKIDAAQEALMAIYNERLSPSYVMDYIIENRKASFAGQEERSF